MVIRIGTSWIVAATIVAGVSLPGCHTGRNCTVARPEHGCPCVSCNSQWGAPPVDPYAVAPHASRPVHSPPESNLPDPPAPPADDPADLDRRATTTSREGPLTDFEPARIDPATSNSSTSSQSTADLDRWPYAPANSESTPTAATTAVPRYFHPNAPDTGASQPVPVQSIRVRNFR
jgi:hypothetical protein